jgi:ribosomal protein S18 acetylase RimI-like enzyme
LSNAEALIYICCRFTARKPLAPVGRVGIYRFRKLSFVLADSSRNHLSPEDENVKEQTPGGPMSIVLRPVGPEDETFLFDLYAGTRADEMAEWGWNEAQQSAFLSLQFNGQQASYRMQFPQAVHRLILFNYEPAGRMIVLSTDEEVRLVDISLLAQHRKLGIGSRLIRGLCAEAAGQGKPCRLRVLRSNRAAERLYLRLGFIPDGESDSHIQMEWRAGAR